MPYNNGPICKSVGVRVCIAGLVVWAAAGRVSSEEALVSSRRQTQIAPQELNAALLSLAKGFDIQLLYRTEMAKGIKSSGALGDLTASQALDSVLRGTGLTYKYIDEKSITIIPIESAADSSHNKRADPTDKRQSHPARDGKLERGQQESGSLAEVVVTAEKREERLSDVPIPVSVLRGQGLIDSHNLQIQDYYVTIPGVDLTAGFRGESYVAIRGITTDIYSKPSVAIAIDDVPYGSSTSIGGGNIIPAIDPNDLSRIEVLRGPQGALYGANNIGGLIKYVTEEPSIDEYSGRVQAGTSIVRNGTELGYVVRASVNVPLSDSWAIRAGGFSRSEPGFVENAQSEARAINQVSSDGFQFSSLWKPSDVISFKVNALVQNATSAGPSEVQQQGLADLQAQVLPGSGRYDANLQSYSANLSTRFDGITFTALTGYNVHTAYAWFDVTPIYGTYTQTTFGLAGSSSGDRRRTDKYTQELRLLVPISQRLEWLVGGFYTHENSPYDQHYYAADFGTGALGSLFLQAAVLSAYREYAAFSDFTYHFSDAFDVQFGGRESQINQSVSQVVSGQRQGAPVSSSGDSSASAFTYLLTPRLKLAPDVMLYARLASGYRPGGPNVSAKFVGQPTQYASDETRNYEIGMKGEFLNHTLFVDSSLYLIDWKGIQLPLSINGFSFYANGSRAISKGVELTAAINPTGGLKIAGWLTWANASLTEALPPNSIKVGSAGDRLPNSPRFSGNLSVEQSFPISNHVTGFASATAMYVGERLGSFQRTSERQIYPGYARFDARAGARYQAWTLNLFVTNLADRRGILGGGLDQVPTTAFSIIQPRTAGLSLSRTF